MNQNTIFLSGVILALTLGVAAQVPMDTAVQIVKAEDARRYDTALEGLMRSPNPAVRARAALAAGRIGHENAIQLLTALLNDDSNEVRAMAAFAIGEIESIKAADAVLKVLAATRVETRAGGAPAAASARGVVVASVQNITARLLEAAGKIGAANPRDPKSKELGEAILQTLQAEPQNREIVLLGITTLLRVRPEKSDFVTAKFLTHADARIRSDAANTLTRLRAKNANAQLRTMLERDPDAVARANAARALGAAEDKDAFDLLLKAVTSDNDSRVRVSAIRSLVSLKDAKAVDQLLLHADKLLVAFTKRKLADYDPAEKSELLEIATTLGRLKQGSNDEQSLQFLTALAEADRYRSPETEIAFARISPGKYSEYLVSKRGVRGNHRVLNAATEGMRELANLDNTPENLKIKKATTDQLSTGLFFFDERDPQINTVSVPGILAAYAAFKPERLDRELRHRLDDADVQIRATAASLLGDLPASKENFDALKSAFSKALVGDKRDNDAQLAIMGALFKLDKKGSLGVLTAGLDARDYLVRRRAFDLLKTVDVKDLPGVLSMIENAMRQKKDQVQPYSPVSGTNLGQVLNTDADYRRALSRKNGTVKAVFATEKGSFTIDFYPEETPLTVDNFVKLARTGYFNGLEVHRVVPNFVMQDGDPRGDGNGGPGWSIRCEVNMLEYKRGAVGMALSGKDTGGSQWFVTHSPQPHLDGGYTVFGQVNERDMRVVDNIVRGDKILSVRIVERGLPQKAQKTQKDR